MRRLPWQHGCTIVSADLFLGHFRQRFDRRRSLQTGLQREVPEAADLRCIRPLGVQYGAHVALDARRGHGLESGDELLELAGAPP